MNAREELIIRLAETRRAALGDMSDAAYEELRLAVRESPESFVDTPANQAFLMVCSAIERFEKDCEDNDLLDDDEYYRARTKRHARMASDCDRILEVDPGCTDARLLRILALKDNPELLLDALLDMEEPIEAEGDAWDDVLLRPQLRIRAAAVRACMETARYRMA
ncbi:MAG: hypothetical protein Q4D39_06830, partial [Coriobacteriaceae bacterium]|nr:hypothetical protein [Coriobacteriaceae bacterium]